MLRAAAAGKLLMPDQYLRGLGLVICRYDGTYLHRSFALVLQRRQCRLDAFFRDN